MPTQTTGAPPAVAIIVGIIYSASIITGYVIVLIALWRGMKAHERIAEKVGEIADKLQQK